MCLIGCGWGASQNQILSYTNTDEVSTISWEFFCGIKLVLNNSAFYLQWIYISYLLSQKDIRE